MIFRCKLLSLLLPIVPALLAGLTFPRESQAENKPKPQPPASKPAKAGSALTESVKFEQAESLRKAFIVLAGGNHDYDGHRVKAMHAVKAGVKLLDESVMKHGTAQQKAATIKGHGAVARAEEAAKHTPIVHERQPASDAQLRGADQLVAQVHATLVTHKQQKVLTHVDRAINEIAIALKIR